MKEALSYRKLKEKEVQCQVCAQNCYIKPGNRGICAVRENQNGVLYSLNYGRVISEAIDPIEKKPLYHFLPKTNTYSIACVGCNLSCDNCQNWQISQYPRLKDGDVIGEKVTPDQIIRNTIDSNCPSISYTYTEPTIFAEFALDTMILAKEAGLKNIWVSNGYTSPQTRKAIIPHLDAINVDLKFFDDELYKKYCGCHLDPVLESLIDYKKNKVWLEVTTLIIPTLTDQDQNLENIAEFIATKLGKETPWHISRFSPQISYKLQELFPTPIEIINKAYEIGKNKGLKNIYKGNI